MPRQPPRVFRPTEVQQLAMRVLTTPSKQDLVRFLALHPGGTTTAEVVRRFGISRPAARIRLTELEQAGVVVANLPRGERRGRRVRFTVDHDRLEELVRELSEYVRGR